MSLAQRLAGHLGLHHQKLWDWDAFPASRGYPELSRAQMRYIGAGGSPKTGDPSTLAPSCFTCSLIYLDPERYAAVHAHEIEEIFFVHEGRLTVSWQRPNDEFVDVMLGPGDLLLNPSDVPHGFRNDGPQPVVAQFMVGHPRPLNPAYKYHPNKGDPGPTFNQPLLPPDDERSRWIRQYVVRGTDVATAWVDAGFAHQPYVLPKAQGGIVEPGHYSLEMVSLLQSAATPWYRFDFETAFMVWDGVLSVEWADDGDEQATARLARRDLVQVPAGQKFRLRNDAATVVRAAAMIGNPLPPADLWRS
ncbi:MAG: cupin domain-containing protein [Chloroflexi bacterium]|nr:cupin domain-containing protein [Chloroflexota bacterium]MBV9892579.1 cupin domain-containing protein [Chloroflexota bacterium]